ncbi:TPA: hypothetical protein N0F65_005595 [Lagenidium giganteum]|uniref:Nudix hydrolase domain-containing protein n=1 Tax=Lagenidium giganteum TaxID=4803 RepID=A0AAV2Z516_9STRA|nr:TPA: hypothetical protein N0F65_005595 [Lagenidium giganteum]
MKFHKSEVLNDVWVQFLVLATSLALSVDSLNPIKAVSRVMGIPSSYWGILWAGLMLALLYNNMAEAVYRCTRTYLHSILSISFKSIEVVGADNIPKEGPVIFTGNHTNQFVDGMVVLMNCHRKVGFMIAEKSWHRPVIGDFSRVMGCIPVVRPQDSVINGVGKVKMAQPAEAALDDSNAKKEFLVVGEGTNFTAQVTAGDQIRLQGKTVKESGSPVKILKVLDDTQLIVEAPLKNGEDKSVLEFSVFGIFKKVDQSVTFAKVYNHLKKGNCIGIFPEGGSHDRTDLLPLKAGVSIMALGVKDKYNINAAVVPVGLNYFRGHRFRGRVVVEFGTPITVDNQLMKDYATDKRKACNEFLHRVEEGMRSVIVTAPDYNIMQLVYAARRLFQRSGLRLSAKQTQDLNRRFAEGYKVLSALPGASKDLEDLQKKLDDYNKTLKLMGLKDHQVPFIQWWTIHDVIGSALYGLLIFLLASIPTFVLNAPVGLAARYLAQVEQKKALAGSKVKVAGRDVLLSKKIMFSMVAVPALWFSYLVAAVVFTDWYWSSIFLLLLSFPLFSFFGVRSVEAGIIELKTIRPLFYRLLPKYRAIQDDLPRQRLELQKEVREFVRKYRSELGVLAESKKVDWTEYMHSRALIEEAAKAQAKSQETASEKKDDENASEARVSEDVAEPPVTITKDHDLSILKKSVDSVTNLASLERSMSCPPGFEELLERQQGETKDRDQYTSFKLLSFRLFLSNIKLGTFLPALQRQLVSPANQQLLQSQAVAGASVAAVFRWRERQKRTLELLFVRRSINEWDTWSGQVAFPGGKRQQLRDSEWETYLETAQRETLEEIGLDLTQPHVHHIGSLPSIKTHIRSFSVSTQVFFIDAAADEHDFVPVIQDAEIADVMWVDIQDLYDPARYQMLTWPLEDMMPFLRTRPTVKRLVLSVLGNLQFGCIYLPRPTHEYPDLDMTRRHRHDFILWGLTLRMFSDLAKAAGHHPTQLEDVMPSFESKTIGRLCLFLYRHPDQALKRAAAFAALCGAMGLVSKL